MTKHYIYEIFGKKIGATNDVKRRMQEQGIKEGEYRVIEEHTNAKTTSIREIELQKQYSYPVDKLPYWKTLKNSKKAQNPISQAKRVANTDYSKIDYKASRAKAVANTDYKAARIKGAANTDYKAKVINTDYKAARAKAVANTDYSKIDWKAARAKAVANTDYSKIDYKASRAKIEKPVNQYSLEGTFIKRWNSATDAAKELNLYNSGICFCLKGKCKTSGKFIWKYTN